MSLTKKQQLFVKEYVSDPAIGKIEAARRAGFSPSRAQIRACELMRNPEVQREIERQLNKKVARVEITPDSVLADLNDIDEMCKQAGAGAWQVATRVKIAELKGKYLKMFTEKVEVGFDDALMEKLLEGRQRVGLPSPDGTPGTPALPEGNAPVQ